MAREITDERVSLSIAIVSALTALRNKSKIIWLKMKSKSNDFASTSNCISPNTSRSRRLPVEVDSPMSVEAHSSVTSEADRLIATIESSRWRPTKAELCIWIICSFYENLCIPVDDLVTYGMSLNLFDNVHDMIGARDRLYDLIQTMNETMHETCSETLDDIFFYDLVTLCDNVTLSDKEYDSEYVKLPNTVYWVALVISRRYSIFQGNRGMRTWNETERYKNCYVLSLVVKYISEHPVNWEFPKLCMLQLTYGRKGSRSLPVEFFERMEELRVLILNVPSLSQSLNGLRNLQTLRLKLLESKDISAIGGLVNLEFLSISTFGLIDIPREMGQLGNLRFLDLRKMNFAYIPSGVLSKMLKLEELYLPLSFRMWGCKAKEVIVMMNSTRVKRMTMMNRESMQVLAR